MLLVAFVFSLLAIQCNQVQASLPPISIFQAAVSNYNTAYMIAHSLLQEKSAASVNIMGDNNQPITTFTLVGDTIEENRQYILVIKSRSSYRKKIIYLIQTEDKTDAVPEVIEMPITDSNPEFHKWVIESTRPDGGEL